MRILVVAVVCALLAVSHAEAGWNQWTTLGPGPNPAPVVIDPLTPATIYTAGPTDAGQVAYRSADGGAHWTSSGAGLAGLVVNTLAVDPKTPSILYAGAIGADDWGVFKSTDGGQTWSPSHAGFPPPPDEESVSGRVIVVVDPQTGSTLYAGTAVGIFKSTNAGASWSAQNAGLSNPFVTALAIDPRSPSTLYAATLGGVFKSTNAAASWSGSHAGLPTQQPSVFALTVDAHDSATVYAGTTAGVFKSTNGGASWTLRPGIEIAPDGHVSAVVVDPQSGSLVYAATFGSGIYRSTDGGQSWAPFNAGLPGRFVKGLAISPSGACLHAAEAGGVFSFVTTFDPCASPVNPFIGVNANRFEAGQTLSASVGLLNLGGPGAIDAYLGVVVHDGHDTTVFFTSASTFALGTFDDLSSYRPVATGVPLATAFATSIADFFSYRWAGAEPSAEYTFFIYAVRAGALADGVLSPEEVLGFATTGFSFMSDRDVLSPNTN
jgi:photosystem II stability/assembly factor-like uncharacterized protein